MSKIRINHFKTTTKLKLLLHKYLKNYYPDKYNTEDYAYVDSIISEKKVEFVTWFVDVLQTGLLWNIALLTFYKFDYFIFLKSWIPIGVLAYLLQETYKFLRNPE